MSQKTETPDAYYDNRNGQFWFNKNHFSREVAKRMRELGHDTAFMFQYTEANQRIFTLYLRELGFSQVKPADKPLSPLEEMTMQIIRTNDVSYAGPLAGFNAGEREILGKRILVTESPTLLAPEEGEFPTLQELLGEQFGADQLPYVLGWLKWSYECLCKGIFRPGQMLALAGPAGCGKSLFQSLVTEILGGRVAKPYRYMTGDTQFNADLFGAEHLCIEDEAASTDLRTRREFGANLKNLIVNQYHSFHSKGKNALTLPAFWRVTLSLNEEPENLMVLPPMDESLKDKVMLLKMNPPGCFNNDDTVEQKDKWRRTLSKEIPAFLWMLKKWKIPKKLRDVRYGVKAFHHPALLEELNQLSPEQRLLELIEGASLFKSGDWSGSAHELEQHLRGSNHAAADRLFSFNSACGTYLKRLLDKNPERFQKKKSGNSVTWTIKEK